MANTTSSPRRIMTTPPERPGLLAVKDPTEGALALSGHRAVPRHITLGTTCRADRLRITLLRASTKESKRASQDHEENSLHAGKLADSGGEASFGFGLQNQAAIVS